MNLDHLGKQDPHLANLLRSAHYWQRLDAQV